jgi:hypothetical protein
MKERPEDSSDSLRFGSELRRFGAAPPTRERKHDPAEEPEPERHDQRDQQNATETDASPDQDPDEHRSSNEDGIDPESPE